MRWFILLVNLGSVGFYYYLSSLASLESGLSTIKKLIILLVIGLLPLIQYIYIFRMSKIYSKKGPKELHLGFLYSVYLGSIPIFFLLVRIVFTLYVFYIMRNGMAID